MFVVDTNILLYAAETHFPEHERCRAALERWRRQASAWFLTWPIVFEFLRVSTHPRVFTKPWNAEAAWGFVEVLMREHGVKEICTRDMDFHRFDFLTVIDPKA